MISGRKVLLGDKVYWMADHERVPVEAQLIDPAVLLARIERLELSVAERAVEARVERRMPMQKMTTAPAMVARMHSRGATQ